MDRKLFLVCSNEKHSVTEALKEYLIWGDTPNAAFEVYLKEDYWLNELKQEDPENYEMILDEEIIVISFPLIPGDPVITYSFDHIDKNWKPNSEEHKPYIII